MTYVSGGNIQAIDYNSFVFQINQIVADSNSGSIVAPPADFGYGHIPLTTVDIGDIVDADEWTALFETIKDIGTHQGTILDTSGIPSLVEAGDIVYAIAALNQVVNSAKASRLSIDPSQVAMVPLFTPEPSYSLPQWTSGLEFTFTVDFGSWNSARHYFNLGGALGISLSIPDGAPLSPNRLWYDLLTDAGLVKLDHTETTSNGIVTGNIGFYNLTTTYQEIYRINPPGYYSGSYMNIRARLDSPPGTNGIVEFIVGLYDGELVPPPKIGPVTVSVNSYQSAGVLPYLGTVSAATVGGVNGFALVPFNSGGNPMLVLSLSPTSLTDTIVGSGTATAGPITCTVLDGVPPYSFNWTNITSSPNTVTISSPVNTPTSSQVSISKLLSNGESFTGTIRCSVTDGAAETSFLNANWSFTSTGVPSAPFINLTAGTLPTSQVYSNTTFGPDGFLIQATSSPFYVTSPLGVNGTWAIGTFNWGENPDGWGSAASPTRYVTSGFLGGQTRIFYRSGPATWTLALTPPVNQQFRIGYGNGLFVAFQFNSPDFYTSPDGINWTQRSNPSPASVYSVPIYSSTLSRWVVLSNTGSMTSVDGITWNMNIAPPFGSFSVPTNNNSVFAESNGTFLATVNNNTLAKSTDGLNWSTIPAPASSAFATIAGSTGGFVYIPNLTANVYTSFTGDFWQLYSNPHGIFSPRGAKVEGNIYVCAEDGTNRFIRGILS